VIKSIFKLAAAFWIMSVLFTAGTSAEVQVWTSDIITNDMAGTAVKELKAVTLVGAKNGTFSGKIVVESSAILKGVKASAGVLTGKDGIIPAQNIQIRYGKFWDKHGNKEPRGPDILMETSPEAAPVKDRNAIIPVWVTVKVPKDAKAGIYSGEITVQPAGSASVKVKLNISVEDWTLPDSQDYRIFSDFVQSPDSLALEYNVPLWSEKHWKLIDRSFKLLSPTGGRVVYVPLICRTNFGNEQTMVRWIKNGENKYEYDYTILDRYLDSAEKNLGKPKQIIFLVWDICMSVKSLERGLWGNDKGQGTREGRTELLGKGPRVTLLNPVTSETGVLTLPRYEDPASKALWQPMFAEVLKRMRKRELEKNMMLGIMPDLWPNKEEVAFWKEISGGSAWAIHGHAGSAKDVMIGNKGLYKIADIGYAAFVYNLVYNVNPDKGRLYGWQNPALLSSYQRFEMNAASTSYIRQLLAFNITGGQQRGLGRLSAEFWYAVKNKKGERSGAVHSRYPENNWRNLDIADWFLAPGPDGALATARLESFVEGTQVCEARIFLEDALLTSGKKLKLGADLAKRCQEGLDEHHHAMWKTVWSNDEDLKLVGKTDGNCRNPPEALWFALEKAGKKLPEYWSGPARTMRAEEARKGQELFVVGWQEREKKLFALAGEVAAKLETK